MKPKVFTLTEPEYRALRLKAEEAKRLRRAMQKARARLHVQDDHAIERAFDILDRALARRKR